MDPARPKWPATCAVRVHPTGIGRQTVNLSQRTAFVNPRLPHKISTACGELTSCIITHLSRSCEQLNFAVEAIRWRLLASSDQLEIQFQFVRRSPIITELSDQQRGPSLVSQLPCPQSDPRLSTFVENTIWPICRPGLRPPEPFGFIDSGRVTVENGFDDEGSPQVTCPFQRERVRQCQSPPIPMGTRSGPDFCRARAQW